jgi:Fe-S cluster assembly protein SufD
MHFLEKDLNQLIQFWDEEPDAWRTLRNSAFKQYKEVGIPNRKWEGWQFTDFSALEKTSYRLAAPSDIPPVPKTLPTIDNCNRILIINGHFQENLSVLPDKVTVQTMQQAYATNPEILNQAVVNNSNPFHNLNTALMNSGLAINVGNNAVIDEPIHILYYTTRLTEPIMNHPLFLIVAGAGSETTIIEHYAGETNVQYWQNVVTNIKLSNNAVLNHTRIQEEDYNGSHIADTVYSLGKDAQLNAFHFASGSSLYRQNIQVNLASSGASSMVNGLCIAKDHQHLDQHIIINHLKENCNSNQLFKYILSDTSAGVFNGRVTVSEGAQKTDAQQTTRNLLLTDRAMAHSNPQLEIYADDVKCAHGSTTGQLDKNAIFYLRSRGIDVRTAQLLLISGFAKEVMETITNINIEAYIDEKLTTWLEHIGVTL